MTDSEERLAQAKAEIDQVFKTLDRRNHFQLLGVDEDTNAEQLRAAYHHLAKKWHADQYAGLNLGVRKKRLDEIFQRIGEAYETLSDKKLRAEYMVLMRRQAEGLATDVNSILRAEALIDEATADIRRKRWQEAKDGLLEARKLNPDDPLYDVHLAWATYNHHRDRKDEVNKALNMLRDAVKRQESLPLAYQYGGHILFAQESYEEAKKWWRKCLQWERKNVEALRGLRLIHTREEKKKQGLGGLINRLFGK